MNYFKYLLSSVLPEHEKEEIAQTTGAEHLTVWVINATLFDISRTLESSKKKKKRHLKRSSFDCYSLNKTRSSEINMQRVFIFIFIFLHMYI